MQYTGCYNVVYLEGGRREERCFSESDGDRAQCVPSRPPVQNSKYWLITENISNFA